MKTYQIHLIQHGKTTANYEGRYIGLTDLPLSDEGIAELTALKNTYRYPPAELVLSSPLARCRQTAAILYPDADIVEEPYFTELDFGDFENLRGEDLAENKDFITWLADSFENAPPNGETGRELLARTTEGVNKLFRQMVEENISHAAVITHGGIIAMLLAAYGIPKGSMEEWLTRHGEGYTIRLEARMWLSHGIFEALDMLPLDMEEEEQTDEEAYDYIYDVYNDYTEGE